MKTFWKNTDAILNSIKQLVLAPAIELDEKNSKFKSRSKPASTHQQKCDDVIDKKPNSVHKPDEDHRMEEDLSDIDDAMDDPMDEHQNVTKNEPAKNDRNHRLLKKEYEHFDENNESFVCPVCQKKYKESARFKFARHVREFHLLRKCDRCQKSLLDKNKFMAHMKRCNKKIIYNNFME